DVGITWPVRTDTPVRTTRTVSSVVHSANIRIYWVNLNGNRAILANIRYGHGAKIRSRLVALHAHEESGRAPVTRAAVGVPGTRRFLDGCHPITAGRPWIDMPPSTAMHWPVT